MFVGRSKSILKIKGKRNFGGHHGKEKDPH